MLMPLPPLFGFVSWLLPMMVLFFITAVCSQYVASPKRLSLISLFSMSVLSSPVSPIRFDTTIPPTMLCSGLPVILQLRIAMLAAVVMFS